MQGQNDFEVGDPSDIDHLELDKLLSLSGFLLHCVDCAGCFLDGHPFGFPVHEAFFVDSCLCT